MAWLPGHCAQSLDVTAGIHELPETFGAEAGESVLDGNGAAQTVYVGCGVGTLNAVPARIGLPGLGDVGAIILRSHVYSSSLSLAMSSLLSCGASTAFHTLSHLLPLDKTTAGRWKCRAPGAGGYSGLNLRLRTMASLIQPA